MTNHYAIVAPFDELEGQVGWYILNALSATRTGTPAEVVEVLKARRWNAPRSRQWIETPEKYVEGYLRWAAGLQPGNNPPRTPYVKQT